jgi:hypothetical protein
MIVVTSKFRFGKEQEQQQYLQMMLGHNADRGSKCILRGQNRHSTIVEKRIAIVIVEPYWSVNSHALLRNYCMPLTIHVHQKLWDGG